MKVSIITVCLNSVHTIEQAIKSVLNQSYKNIEYIVIDGASTDGTCDVIEKYREKLAYYVSEPDEGIYYAMNKGICKATGDIIGILNSDDYYGIDTIEKVVNTFEKCNCQMVHGELGIVYNENEYRIIKERKLSDLYIGMVIAHPTVFIKKSIYQQYGLFDVKYKSAADYELMLRLYEKGISIVFIPELLTYFRQGGYSQINEKLNMEEAYCIAQKYINKNNRLEKKYLLERVEQNYTEKMYRYQIGQTVRDIDEVEKKELLKETKLEKSIVIFGTGSYGIICYELLKKLTVDFEAWVDNDDLTKKGRSFLGKSIYTPEEAISKPFMYIVASKDYEYEMIEQLKRLKISGDDYITLSDLEKIIMKYRTKKDENRKSKT